MFEDIHALIIEDDHSSQDVLQALLERLGVSHTTVSTPVDVTTVLRSLPRLNIIFLDLDLPVKDGYEVLDDIYAEIGKTIPVVAYTAHTTEIVEARKAGFHSFLGKPLNGNKFAEQLESILSDVPVWSRPT
ncbi:MAG: response regulator [Chloroflexi bacterium]|nr:response regulator [Chloroflexota bacterium]